MANETVQQYKEQLRNTKEQLTQGVPGDAEFLKVQELIRRIYDTSKESLHDLRTDIESIATEVEKYASTNEKAAQAKVLLSQLPERMEALRARVAAKANPSNKDQKWYERIGSLFSGQGQKTANSLAFIFGSYYAKAEEAGAAKQVQAGFLSGLVSPLRFVAEWFVGKDRMKLAGYLKAAGFTGIKDSDASMDTLMLTFKSKFSGVDKDKFFADLAQKAPQFYKGTVSFKELNDLALTMATENEGKKTETKQDTKEKTPEITQGDMLKTSLDIEGAKVKVAPDGRFERTVGSSVKRWQLKAKDVTSFTLTKAMVDVGGNLDLAVMINNTTYASKVKPDDLKKMVTSMGTDKVTESIAFAAGDQKLSFELVPVS